MGESLEARDVPEKLLKKLGVNMKVVSLKLIERQATEAKDCDNEIIRIKLLENIRMTAQNLRVAEEFDEQLKKSMEAFNKELDANGLAFISKK